MASQAGIRCRIWPSTWCPCVRRSTWTSSRSEVIRLWSALPDGDQRIYYEPRHQAKPAHGRFKAPKNTGVTAAVESLKRSLIGPPGGPAQWPSTSRLVEAVCIKLCSLHKSPAERDGVQLPGWSKVLSDYQHIPDLVVDCHTLMEATSLQLLLLIRGL
ncbi:uncharacterized protein V3H82_021473 [Fundulus diaphanus]